MPSYPLEKNPSGIVFVGDPGPYKVLSTETDFVYKSGDGYLGINNSNPQYTIDASGTGNFIAIRFPDGTVQTTAASGVGGGSGTLDGSGSLYQIAYWLDSNTLSGDNALVILPGSGLSGSLIQTSQIQFPSGGTLNISSEDGTDIANFSDSGTGILFEIIDSDNNTIFSISDDNDSILEITASSGQISSLIQVNDESGNLIAYIDINGNYSGNNIIFGDGTVQTTAYTGQVGGGGGSGTIDGSGELYQITLWYDNNTISGNNDLIYIPNSGLSGTGFLTDNIYFFTGLNISNTSGNAILSVNNTVTSLLLDIQDSSGNSIFTFNDTGNYSGNSITFGDGTVQTTAYTGQTGGGGTTSPAGNDGYIQYNISNNFSASDYFKFETGNLSLNIGSGGNIGIGDGVFSGINPQTDNIAIGRYASWDALNTHDRTIYIGSYAGANTSTSTNSDDVVGIGSNSFQNASGGVARGIGIGSAAYSGAYAMYDSVAIGYAAGQGSYNQNYSVFVGREAGRNSYHSTTQTHNVGIGYRALDGVLDGLGNIGIGRESLTGVDGSYNINIGYRGGYDASGERNTVLGFQAGRYINGRNNIFIGDSAGNLTTGDYNLEIITDSLNSIIRAGNWTRKINIDNIFHADSSTQKIQVGNVDGTLSPNGTFEIISSDTSVPVIIVQGAVSQNDNLIEFQNSSTNIVAYVDSTGSFSGVDFTFNDTTTQTTAFNNFDIRVGSETPATISDGDTVTFTGLDNIAVSRLSNVLTFSGIDLATNSSLDTISGNLQSQITSNDSDISDLQTATGNLDVRVTQNTSDINTVSGLLYNYWTITDGSNSENINSTDTVKFTGAGLATVSYNTSNNTVTISGQGGGGTMDSWNLSVTGDSTVIGDGETVTFSGQDGINITRNANTVIISGSSAGGGTIDGGGSTNQITYWVDNNTISGNDSLIYIPNSGLSGSLLQTTEIQFPSGSELNINTDAGSSIASFSNTGGNVLFEIIDSGNNEIFSISDDGSATLEITASAGQTENLISIFDSSTGQLAYIDINGNYSGNNIIFGDGTTQTTAFNNFDIRVGSETPGTISNGDTITFTGLGSVAVSRLSNVITISGSAGGGGTPAGADSQIQYNNAGSFGASEFFNFNDTNYTLQLGSSGNIGIGSGVLSTTGTYHVAIGEFALSNTNSGNNNVAIGYYAGYSVSGSETPSNNIFIGFNAGLNAESIERTTMIGARAGQDSFSHQTAVMIGPEAGRLSERLGGLGDSYNLAIGRQASYGSTSRFQIALGNEVLKNSSGEGQISLGYLSGSNSSGNYLVSIGYRNSENAHNTDSVFLGRAVGNNSSGQYNIGIGYGSLRNNSGLNNIEIVTEDAFTTELLSGNSSNKLNIEHTIVGDTLNKLLAIGNVGASTYLTPNATLQVVPNSSSDIVLIVQGAPGQTADLQEWQDSSNNVFAKVNANGEFSNNQSNSVGSEFFGAFAGRSASGNYNVGVGYYALNSINSGDYNVGIGYQAGHAISGSQIPTNNIFVGRDAGIYAESAERSVMIGARAGQDSYSQQVSVFVGPQAGELAIAPSLTDTYNIGIGRQALYGATNVQKVGIGNEALKNSVGEGQIAIGHLTGSSASGSYLVGIGFRNSENSNNRDAIFIGRGPGNNSSGEYNIGIGYGCLNSNSGTNNIEIVTEDAFTTKLLSGSNSNKLNIEHTIVGDTLNKLIAVGNVGTSTYLTPNATLQVVPNTSTDIVIIAQGAVSQTANLQEWQSNAGLAYAHVNPTGGISGTSVTFPDGSIQTTAYTGQVGGGGGTPGGSDTQVQYNNAGSFAGDPNFTWNAGTSTLNVSGAFTATTKSFLINHPTKSGSKLRYGSLEGPENGVYVRGTSNERFIYLPDYWSGLVHEDSITVNLTPVGKFQPLYVEEKNDAYIVIGGVDGYYDYIVYAERKDVDKLVVEE